MEEDMVMNCMNKDKKDFILPRIKEKDLRTVKKAVDTFSFYDQQKEDFNTQTRYN
jgi:hypothetical protein